MEDLRLIELDYRWIESVPLFEEHISEKVDENVQSGQLVFLKLLL